MGNLQEASDLENNISISARRFEESPFIERTNSPQMIRGVYAGRYFPIYLGEDPIQKYWTLRQKALILRGKTAKSRMGVKRQLQEVDIDGAMNRFETYERKLDVMEGEIESYDLGQQSLANEIADLEADEKVDEELAKLKARLSGGSETEQ